MLALLAKLSQTHFYWMLDTRTELFSHVQIFKDKVSRYDKKKKSVRFGDHRIPFLLFPDDVIPLAASIGDTLEWWFEATHKVTEIYFGTSKSAGYRASSAPHRKEPTEMVQASDQDITCVLGMSNWKETHGRIKDMP